MGALAPSAYACAIVGAVTEIIVGEIVSALIGAGVAITLMTTRRDNNIYTSLTKSGRSRRTQKNHPK